MDRFSAAAVALLWLEGAHYGSPEAALPLKPQPVDSLGSSHVVIWVRQSLTMIEGSGIGAFFIPALFFEFSGCLC